MLHFSHSLRAISHKNLKEKLWRLPNRIRISIWVETTTPSPFLCRQLRTKVQRKFLPCECESSLHKTGVETSLSELKMRDSIHAHVSCRSHVWLKIPGTNAVPGEENRGMGDGSNISPHMDTILESVIITTLNIVCENWVQSFSLFIIIKPYVLNLQ